MKIESIILREIRMPLVHFFETSFGRTTDRNIVLVEVIADGVSAWGECVAGEHPFYSEESYETAWYALEQYLAPAIVGKEVASGAELPRALPGIRGTEWRRQRSRTLSGRQRHGSRTSRSGN
ncbi:MAG: hypothetical protein NVS9B15_17860 [Acidobacteriaceae bacterium]